MKGRPDLKKELQLALKHTHTRINNMWHNDSQLMNMEEDGNIVALIFNLTEEYFLLGMG